jgi:hypothetical protein
LPGYLTPWESGQHKSQITDYGQWCQAWSRHAATHVVRGDEALAAGRPRTADDATCAGQTATMADAGRGTLSLACPREQILNE